MELPGLSLQVDQAARLFGVDRAETERILEALVRVGFLRRSTVGGFARNDSRP
jgi:DNA-binding IclR family transcriptional regulator